MRILLIHPAIFIGGAERVVVGLLSGLLKQGHDAQLLTLSVSGNLTDQFDIPEDSVIVPESRTGGRLFGLNYRDAKVLADAAGDVRTLARELKKNAPSFDLVNPHNFPASVATGLAKVEQPVVWNCNEPYPLILREDIRTDTREKLVAKMLSRVIGPFDRFLVRSRIGTIVVFDEFNQKRVQSFYGRPSAIVHPPLDSERFRTGHKDRVLEEFGLEGCFVLLQVGWLNPLKNQQASVRALKRIVADVPNARLILVGGGGYLATLKEEVRRLGLEDYVVFAGHVPDETLPDFYHACDVNLFPNFAQSWGLAPLEALAAGKVSIVSVQAGVAEVLAKHKAAIIVEPDEAEIERAVLALYNGQMDAAAMTRQGQELLRTELTWESYVARMIRVFERAVASQGRTG